jgi:hypothetical protein
MSYTKSAIQVTKFALLLCVGLAAPSVALAQNLNKQFKGPAIRVEEDWEIQIGRPDAAIAVPSIDLLMLPDPVSMPDFGGMVLLNYHMTPEYSGGGAEVQLWTGDKTLVHAKSDPGKKLELSNERVKLTTYLEVASNGDLTFGVMKGATRQFGDTLFRTGLSVTTPTKLKHLDNYSPQQSVDVSGIVHGHNRVTSMQIIEVRRIDSKGGVLVETGHNVFP